MEKDLISIIVPVYKVEKYLDKCVQSIVDQTYENLEIIIIDDSSPDNCPAMCDAWAEKDSRVQVFHIENKGVANSRNFALSKAAGDYIAFADGDDFLEPNMLEILYRNLLVTGADIAVCGYFRQDESGMQIHDSEKSTSPRLEAITAEEALRQTALGEYKFGVLWNKLYKKSVLGGVQMPPLVCSEDLVFNYRAFKNAKRVCVSSQKLYHYVLRSGSTTSAEFSIGAFDAVSAKQIVLNGESGTNIEPYAVIGLAKSCFAVLGGIVRSGKCLDKYDEIRKLLLSYKKQILKSPHCPARDKAKLCVLALSKSLYNKLVLKG